MDLCCHRQACGNAAVNLRSMETAHLAKVTQPDLQMRSHLRYICRSVFIEDQHQGSSFVCCIFWQWIEACCLQQGMQLLQRCLEGAEAAAQKLLLVQTCGDQGGQVGHALMALHMQSTQ